MKNNISKNLSRLAAIQSFFQSIFIEKSLNLSANEFNKFRLKKPLDIDNVNLKYDNKLEKFIIDGSSFKGKTDVDCVIGNWWNHKILQASKQISPLSGSVKEQVVSFVKKEDLIINGKKYSTDHYKLKSKDENLPDDKKLDFDIWYNKEKNLILKVSYSRMGKWEYRLKSYK